MTVSRGGRIGFLVPNRPYGLCGRKATLNSTGRTGDGGRSRGRGCDGGVGVGGRGCVVREQLEGMDAWG